MRASDRLVMFAVILDLYTVIRRGELLALKWQDINFEESVVMIEGVYHWKNIERRLLDMTKEQSRAFDKLPLK